MPETALVERIRWALDHASYGYEREVHLSQRDVKEILTRLLYGTGERVEQKLRPTIMEGSPSGPNISGKAR